MINTYAKMVVRCRMALFSLLLGLTVSGAAQAAERTLSLSGPKQVAVGANFDVVLKAQTQAEAGESIGFLHGEYSLDEGATWTGFCFVHDLGRSTTQRTTLTASKPGIVIIVRARAAFRGGAAGDVDYMGKAIDWDGTWEHWSEPPAKKMQIRIVVK